MECHLVVGTQKDHPPLCLCPWVQRGLDWGEACGHETEHRARQARRRLAEAGVHVMVRRGPCPEAVKFDRQRAEQE